MKLRLWVDDWQMQCCGEPFMVASQVSWHLVEPDPDSLEAMLGEREAAMVTHAEEHHSDDQAPTTEGVVESIWSVYCRMAPLPDSPQVLAPEPDSALLTEVTRATGWEPERDSLTFCGYVVAVRA